ncbi:MAG TPA: metal-dependent hydrolase [Gemmataceae bacterium]|nr:metal-dependent hydrolase [Gemmataceae bacterium]
MPTGFTHAAVGLGLGEVFMGPSQPPILRGLSMALAAAPDLDILGFWLGVPYGSFFGHRGFFHSLFCALLIGLVVAVLSAPALALPWWELWGYFFLITASHGLLDGFTNGGMGIAFFSPFDTGRYFFTGQPIEVSPIGLAFFSKWGVRVLASELVWVWLPLACLVAAGWAYRWGTRGL